MSWCAEYGTCTPEIFNRLFKIDNREQKKLFLAHRRSRRKVPYSADWIMRHHIYCLSVYCDRPVGTNFILGGLKRDASEARKNGGPVREKFFMTTPFRSLENAPFLEMTDEKITTNESLSLKILKSLTRLIAYS